MYLRDLGESLLRRWILVALAVVLTGGACLLAARAIGPTYRMEASIVLVPPKSVVEPTTNRFLELSSLTQAVDVLSRALNADATKDQVRKTAAEGRYEATVDDATSAPVLIVTTEASTADDARALADAVLTQAPASLSALQSALSIAPGAEITSIPLTRNEPQVSQKTRMRAVAAVGILCLAGSLLLIGALDGLLLARAARKGRRRQDDSEADTWFEDELAQISHGVDDAGPAAKATSRDRE